MDRDELHALVMLLKDGVAAGTIKLPEGSQTLRSLNKVRFDIDGIVDPASVDGSVRAAGYAAAMSKVRREMRQIPLRDVQAQYFDILDQFFGKSFSEMKKYRVSPAQVANQFAEDEKFVEAFKLDLPNFVSGVREFWDYYAPVVEIHIEDLRCLKSVFGGDIFPSYQTNIASSVGLYVDTLILPDPLLRLLSFAEFTEPKKACQLVVKHSLSALGYRELALADIDPPIVVVVPDPMILDKTYADALQVASEMDLVEHASKMFGVNFSDLQDMNSFLGKFPNLDLLMGKLVEPKRFLFDADWSGPLSGQYERYVRDTQSKVLPLATASVAETTYAAFIGRMMQTNDLLLRSARYRGTPLIDAPTSWQYLLWKYEYDSARSGAPPAAMQDIVISKAITAEGKTEFGMLSGVPSEALIELRRNGAMGPLRQTFREGLSEIDLASAAALSDVAEQVIKNIDRAFDEHARELSIVASSHRKFFGLDVSRWVVGGGISVAAALAHNVGLAALAAGVPSIIGAPSMLDLRKKWKELRSQSQKLQRSPAAVLFRHLGRKFGFSP
jgi:hypothetical protein